MLGQHRAAKKQPPSRISSFSYFNRIVVEVAEHSGADPFGYVKLQLLPKGRDGDGLAPSGGQLRGRQ